MLLLTFLPLVFFSFFLFRYLVNLGCIKPLCDLLTVMDSKIVQVALNGLENILRLGEQEAKQNCSGLNPYCSLIEEAYGNVFPLSLSARWPKGRSGSVLNTAKEHQLASDYKLN